MTDGTILSIAFWGVLTVGLILLTVTFWGVHYALWRLTGGKAYFDEMQRRHDEQRERVEKRLKER